MKSYFDKEKHKLFPEITDWKDPQNHIRNANPKTLDYKHWFYMHPTAYQLFNYGIDIIIILTFGTATIILLITNHIIPGILTAILGLSGVASLTRKMRIKELNKQTTFYDLWMREYETEEGGG